MSQKGTRRLRSDCLDNRERFFVLFEEGSLCANGMRLPVAIIVKTM